MSIRHREDPAFDTAWRAFVQEDAQAQAPVEVERRILDALRRGRANRSWSEHGRLLATLLAAAALLVAIIISWPRSNTAPDATALRSRPFPPDRSFAMYKAQVPAQAALRSSHERREGPSVARSLERSMLPPTLMTLGASPLGETEALQLVRLRLPREALQGLGVALLEPEAQGVIDVDVLIGEDGLPRDIRHVRAGQE
jgi:hypothetical protein